MEEKYAADPKTAQEIRAFVKEFDKRFNKNDPLAVAALCTEDAIQIGPEGPVCGRQAMKKVCRPLPTLASHQYYLHDRSDGCNRQRFVEFRRVELHCSKREWSAVRKGLSFRCIGSRGRCLERMHFVLNTGRAGDDVDGRRVESRASRSRGRLPAAYDIV